NPPSSMSVIPLSTSVSGSGGRRSRMTGLQPMRSPTLVSAMGGKAHEAPATPLRRRLDGRYSAGTSHCTSDRPIGLRALRPYATVCDPPSKDRAARHRWRIPTESFHFSHRYDCCLRRWGARGQYDCIRLVRTLCFDGGVEHGAVTQ